MTEVRLPKGVYFETERSRYRVRLYYDKRVIWRTHHKTLNEALNAHRDAQMHRLELWREKREHSKPPKTFMELLACRT